METPENRNDQLAEDLRALRPTPHPQFAEELDERAAAGFPRPSRLPRFSFGRLRTIPRWRLLLPTGAVALLAIVVATGVVDTNDESPSGGGSFLSLNSSDFGSEESAPEPAPPVEASAEEAQPLSGVERYSAGGTRLGKRAVERSAEIVFGADPDDVADDSAQVFDVVQAHKGIVMGSMTHQGDAGEAGAHFELRIPSARLGDALADLSAIDEVRSRRETTDDITAPTVKVGELLQESRARIDSMLSQLAEAGTESEREAVEAELRQERRHRARLRLQLQELQRRADFSLVLLEIETSEVSESSSDSGAWGIADALDDAGKILAVAAAVAVVALAILGPIALIALLAWLAHRAWVRRERRRVLS
jgi:hypothetical protein